MIFSIGCGYVNKKYNEIKEVQKSESSEEMLSYLINQYKMNTKSLSKALEIDASILDDFSRNKNKIPMIRRGDVSNTLAIFYYISKINTDERNKAIINGLVQEDNIELETIACMAEVEEGELRNFIEGNGLISYEAKYKIATISMFLHSIFKSIYDDTLKLTIKAIKRGLDNEAINKLVGLSYKEIEIARKLCEQY